MDITVPYFHVDLRWINATGDRFNNVGNGKYADIVSFDINARENGSVGIPRNEPWDVDKALPTAADVFSEEKLVFVKVNTVDISHPLPDGSMPREDTPCPTASSSLGELPHVSQKEISYFMDEKWVNKDCFLVAEAFITAGKSKGKDCIVNPAGQDTYTATHVPNTHPVTPSRRTGSPA
jgi:hypothetical protein